MRGGAAREAIAAQRSARVVPLPTDGEPLPEEPPTFSTVWKERLRVWFDFDQETMPHYPNAGITMFMTYYYYFCSLAHMFVHHKYFGNFMIVVIVGAGITVGCHTYIPDDSTLAPGEDDNYHVFETILNVMDSFILGVFLLEIGLKIFAQGNNPHYFFRTEWNIFDLTVVVVTVLPVGGKSVSVLRLFRLIRIAKLFSRVRPLQILLVGLASGLASIFWIVFLLLLLLFLFAVMAVFFFGKNDPLHFATVELAMISLFRLATLDNWTHLMYINMYGCLYFGYSQDWQAHLCTDSAYQPAIAAVFFILVLVLAGLVVLNLFVGVMTTSMNSAAMRIDEEKAMQQRVLSKVQAEEIAQGIDPGDDADATVPVLKASKSMKHLVSLSAMGNGSVFEETRLERFGRSVDLILYHPAMTAMANLAVLVSSVVVGILANGVDADTSQALNTVNDAVLVVFTVELIFKMLSDIAHPKEFLKSGWNIFDFIVVVSSFVPSSGGDVGTSFLRLLRLLRVIRIVRTITPLQMVIKGLVKGFASIGFISTLLFTLVYVFAIVAVLVFSSYDPFNFGSLHMALISLFRITTLDHWSDILHRLLRGCDVEPYFFLPSLNSTAPFEQAALDYYRSQKMLECAPDLVNPLFATAFFIMFVFLSSFVVLSLFVGVISTSMEDALRDVLQQGVLMKKLATLKREYNLSKGQLLTYVNAYQKYTLERDLSITRPELVNAMRSLDRCISLARLNHMFLELDIGLEQTITIEEWLILLLETGKLAMTNRLMEKPLKIRTAEANLLTFEDNLASPKGIRTGETLPSKSPVPSPEKTGEVNAFAPSGPSNAGAPPDLADGADPEATAVEETSKKSAALERVEKVFLDIEMSPAFIHSLTATIVLAGVLVGVQTYVDSASSLGQWLDVVENVILIIFIIEIVVKLCATLRKPLIYFKSGWNLFDFFVVVMCIMPTSASGTAPLLRLLRLLRVLKVVRVIPQLAVIFSGLVEGMKGVGYVLLLMLLLLYLFGVSALLLFQQNDPVNYGHLGLALMSVTRISTLDDWTEIMYVNMFGCANYGYFESPELCTQSTPQPFLSALYHISLVLMSAIVTLNLFTGIITTAMREAIDNAKEEAKEKRLASKFATFSKALGLLSSAKPREAGKSLGLLKFQKVVGNIITENRQNRNAKFSLKVAFNTLLSRARQKIVSAPPTASDFPPGLKCELVRTAEVCGRITESHIFSLFINTLIMCSAVVVAAQTNGMTDDILVSMSTWLLVVFTVEVVLKLLSAGIQPWRFFVSAWNCFDFVVVGMALLPIESGTLASVLRLLRLGRLLKLVNSVPNLQLIVSGALKGLNSIAFIALLLMLLIYIYANVAVQFFRDSEPWAFGSLHQAFTILFRIATFDEWTELMNRCRLGCNRYPYPFMRDTPNMNASALVAFWHEQNMACKLAVDANEGQPEVALIFFYSYLVLAAFVLLTLFNGVITTGMIEAARQQEANRYRRALLQPIVAAFRIPRLFEERLLGTFEKAVKAAGGEDQIGPLPFQEALARLGRQYPMEKCVMLTTKVRGTGSRLSFLQFVRVVLYDDFQRGTLKSLDMYKILMDDDFFRELTDADKEELAIQKMKAEKNLLHGDPSAIAAPTLADVSLPAFHSNAGSPDTDNRHSVLHSPQPAASFAKSPHSSLNSPSFPVASPISLRSPSAFSGGVPTPKSAKSPKTLSPASAGGHARSKLAPLVVRAPSLSPVLESKSPPSPPSSPPATTGPASTGGRSRSSKGDRKKRSGSTVGAARNPSSSSAPPKAGKLPPLKTPGRPPAIVVDETELAAASASPVTHSKKRTKVVDSSGKASARSSASLKR